MSAIYIVTRGEYSDYGIQGVFSTQELAERFKAELDKEHGDDTDIEEWVLDELLNDRFGPVYYHEINGQKVAQSVSKYVRSDSYTHSISQPNQDYYRGASAKSAEHARELAEAARRIAMDHALDTKCSRLIHCQHGGPLLMAGPS